MSEELFCTSCDLSVTAPVVERIDLPQAKFHLKASCPKCGRYLKFQQQGGPVSLFFGKYKGVPVVEVAAKDPEYCRWLAAQSWCKPKLRRELEAALTLGLDPQ